MSQQALYRKYRSASFGDVIGQDHVVQTLTNAVKTGSVSHAYLLTGSRGVGKTSVARLLAKTITCLDKDPQKRPCGVCASCVAAEAGSNFDIMEIDAASNRGIDDARALREKIGIAPSISPYKVYIIDEVHMLTTEAFNALLKTLEEPPAHAVFILATTEAHKLPETIVSRTQRFAFKPIGQGDLEARLSFIAKQEKIDITPEAITLLARAGHGGFRDAISLLDQVAGSAIRPLDAPAVRQLLGWGDDELIQQITAAVVAAKPQEAVTQLRVLLGQGAQPAQVSQQLIESWRELLMASLDGKGQDGLSTDRIVRVLEALIATHKSPWPELALEAALVRVCLPYLSDAGVAATPAPPIASKAPARAAAPAATAAAPTASEGNEQELWVKALAIIKQRHNSLYTLLRSTNVRFEGDDVIIGCRFSFHRDRLKESKNIQMIESALARVYGRKLRVMPQLETLAKPAPADSTGELVSSALEILGGEVIE